MEDIQILEAVERYILGEMKPDERVYFEQLRKTNTEVDQLVVEHTLFLHNMHELGERKAFKATLNNVHTDLTEKGYIHAERLKGSAKILFLWKRYRRVAAIAASIAGITTLATWMLVWSLSPNAQDDKIKLLDRKLQENDNVTYRLSQEINSIKSKVNVPAITYKTGGTGFIIDAKGYLVTNAHVVSNATNIAIENRKGDQYNARLVFEDKDRDIAILKIDDPNFKPFSSVPYAISKASAELAAPIFTLGYPRNDIVYGQGYLSAKTGFQGDTLSCQIEVAANSGNSGSPILNKNGEVIGVLNGRQTNADGFTFAIHSKYIFSAIEELRKKDTAYARIKMPVVSTIKKVNRETQVKKIEDYIFMVKVS
jgi:S1-C subfamily serine protease